jgi:hypothetical protein
MNIEEELLKAHSTEQSKKIAKYIEENPSKFKDLLKIQNEANYRINQRAGTAAAICVKMQPQLLTPYIQQLLVLLRNSDQSYLSRNILRLLQFAPIPKEFMGDAADICFELLLSRQQPIAVKVFSMTVLYNIAKEESELANELKIVIEDQMDYSSAGFRSRGNKILKGLNKIKIRK